MLNPQLAGIQAENTISEYVTKCGCKDARDVAKVLEMLIAKSARAIETYCGNESAVIICERTVAYLIAEPQRPDTMGSANDDS